MVQAAITLKTAPRSSGSSSVGYAFESQMPRAVFLHVLYPMHAQPVEIVPIRYSQLIGRCNDVVCVVHVLKQHR